MLYLDDRQSPKENSVMRRIFGPKNEITGGWRNLHNEELHNLYPSADIIKVIK
jgi:hypothetical protein